MDRRIITERLLDCETERRAEVQVLVLPTSCVSSESLAIPLFALSSRFMIVWHANYYFRSHSVFPAENGKKSRKSREKKGRRIQGKK